MDRGREQLVPHLCGWPAGVTSYGGLQDCQGCLDVVEGFLWRLAARKAHAGSEVCQILRRTGKTRARRPLIWRNEYLLEDSAENLRRGADTGHRCLQPYRVALLIAVSCQLEAPAGQKYERHKFLW